ncbi:transposon Tf2-6 polyprotein, partial [Trichonephila inaurata madagascariensis]
NRKQAKRRVFESYFKVNIPLSTYHVDFIGLYLPQIKLSTHFDRSKTHFPKFSWLYPVKTVSAENALEKLKLQQKTFGNPVRIITDRGSAFTSKLFNDYCTEENIQHLQIATGIPRGNGQVERIPNFDSVLRGYRWALNEMVQIRRRLQKNTKQHYMSKHKMDHSNF